MSREGKSHVIAVAYRSPIPEGGAQSRTSWPSSTWPASSARKDAASRRAERPVRRRSCAAQGRARAGRGGAGGVSHQRGGRHAAQTLGADSAEIAGLNAQLVAAAVARAGQGRDPGRGCGGWSRAATSRRRRASWAARRCSTISSALKAELLRREAELTGQYGERHPKIQAVRAEQDKLDGRIREERKALLRQFEGEVARARAGERRWPAARGAQGQGAAPRGRRRTHRRARARGRAEPAARTRPGSPARAPRAPHGHGRARLAGHLRGRGPVEPSFPKPRLITVAGADRRAAARASSRCTWSRPASAACARSATWRRCWVCRRSPGAAAGADRGAPASPPQDYVLERPRSRYAEALREILTGLVLRRAEGDAGTPGAGWCWSPPPCPARASRP